MAFDSAYIAGWESADGEWHNTEAGGLVPEPDDLEVSPRIVVAVEDEDGELHYITGSYFTDEYGLDDFLDDADDSEHYGESFV